MLTNVYRNAAAVDDELVDIIYEPSCGPTALDVFVSVITGPPGGSLGMPNLLHLHGAVICGVEPVVLR